MVNGWIEKPLGDLFDFSGGFSASRADLSMKGYPYLHYGDIHGSTRTFIDVCADKAIPRLDIDLNKVSNASLLNDGDVVFVDASEDDEGASRHIVVRNTDNLPFISGLHTIIAKAKDDELDNKFREYCFQTALIKSQFKFYAVGTKVTGISKTTIGKIVLLYPQDKSEQRRIAKALSDTDELIATLEKLIAKKRAIKQGAMQELLTGKRQLPGFSGEWVEKVIRNYTLIVTKGTTPTSVGMNFTNTGITFVKIESIVNNRIDKKLCAFINEDTNKVLSRSILQENDILISIAGALGRSAMVDKSILPANTNQALAIIRLDGRKVCIDYVYRYLQSDIINKHIAEVSVQGAQANLSLEIINDLPLWIPSDISEQTAIASILSDMDAEIDALTAKLNKLRNIKQGMMSELLTGRIRLTMESKPK
jgi:type I restriction enzyme, S subunit